jgi:hypothetical protein
MACERLIFRVHAFRRMFQRNISEEDVRCVLDNGEVIENYSDDTPYPSRLVLGWRGTRPIHVVVAQNDVDDELVIVTAYEPDPVRWDKEFRRRI